MNIFTYGSLMIRNIFISAAGRNFKSQDADLSGYGRFCLKNDIYPGIIISKSDITNGIVYFDVNDVSVRNLDMFEGDYYQRTPVRVTLSDQSIVDAETYVIKNAYRHILSPEKWSFEDFKNKFQHEFRRKYFGFGAVSGKDRDCCA